MPDRISARAGPAAQAGAPVRGAAPTGPASTVASAAISAAPRHPPAGSIGPPFERPGAAWRVGAALSTGGMLAWGVEDAKEPAVVSVAQLDRAQVS